MKCFFKSEHNIILFYNIYFERTKHVRIAVKEYDVI